ncbi:hypothetical protein [Methylobacter sp.]|uniref:hypothetical protein n=1 Tax=Methylobacter sp. TaxID=2051955 RepID=UPI003DA2AC95
MKFLKRFLKTYFPHVFPLYMGGSSGGGGSSKPSYEPTQDARYISAADYLKSLEPALSKNTNKMTNEEILASLPDIQKLITQGNNAFVAPSGPQANWGVINDYSPPVGPGLITPQYAPQYKGGMFSGPQSVSPEILATLQAVLGSSNLSK